MSKIKNRIGEINYNKYDNKMEIVEYINNRMIKVRFENGYTTGYIQYSHFKEGIVKSPYDKSIFGVGYIGEGDFQTNTQSFDVWKNMLRRCYEESDRYPSYSDILVCNEWLNYQNFAEWYCNNYYRIKGERMDIDKDILIKGNKVYRPEACCIVPQKLNGLIVSKESSRGEYPIGVSKHKNRRLKPFIASCSFGKSDSEFLGYFDTPEEAHFAYKIAKEKYIKRVAESYKDKIPKMVYDAFIYRKIDIQD